MKLAENGKVKIWWVQQRNFKKDGREKTDSIIYLICNGGYLCWSQQICPYKCKLERSRKGYFSTKLVGMWTDVNCVFGIVKKRQITLDYGIQFLDFNVVEKGSVPCCIHYNEMLSEVDMKESDVCVGRGAHLPGDV